MPTPYPSVAVCACRAARAVRQKNQSESDDISQGRRLLPGTMGRGYKKHQEAQSDP
jgi:hypothetical protein